MKQETYEKWILLDQAGNLPASKKRKLEAALREEAQLQAYRESLDILSSSSTSTPEQIGPDTTDILRYARRHGPQTNENESFFTLWQPAIGYAALAVALAMVTVYYFREAPMPAQQTAQTTEQVDPAWLAWDAPYQEELAQLTSELNEMQDDFLQTANTADDVSDLATTLLIYGESS